MSKKERKKPTIKELMKGTVLDGYVEAARVKTLDTFAEKRRKTAGNPLKAVVQEKEIPTFTPAFLSKIKEAFLTQQPRVMWEWAIEPDPNGVSVRLIGTSKPHEYFPDHIINRMIYDEEKRHYRVVPV